MSTKTICDICHKEIDISEDAYTSTSRPFTVLVSDDLPDVNILVQEGIHFHDTCLVAKIQMAVGPDEDTVRALRVAAAQLERPAAFSISEFQRRRSEQIERAAREAVKELECAHEAISSTELLRLIAAVIKLLTANLGADPKGFAENHTADPAVRPNG